VTRGDIPLQQDLVRPYRLGDILDLLFADVGEFLSHSTVDLLEDVG
jgi:hypothetical protein